MKKYLIPVILVLGLGLAILKYGKNLLIPGAVQKVRQSSVEILKKNAEDAENLYKKQLDSADKAGRAYLKLGRKYIENKNWTPGINSLKKAVEYGSSGARVHYLLGVAYANRGNELSDEKDITLAENHYRRAIAINDKMLDARYGLSILYFYVKKDYEKAIELAKEIINRDKNYYRARFALARFYYEKEEPAKSLSVYEDLYSDLSSKQDSPKIDELRKKCKENISRLMLEMAGK